MRYINKAARPFTRRTTSAGGKVPPPSAHANAPPGGVRRLARAKHGRSVSPLTRRTTSAVSAANECEGITCLWQVTRNDSDEAERSERSPSGVVSVANGEELAAAGGQVSGEAAPASGSAPQTDQPPPSARGSGGRARRPPEPSAGRKRGARYPPGSFACACTQKLLPSGQLCLFLVQCKVEYKTHVRFESGDESPHSKDASRRGSKPSGDALQRRFASRESENKNSRPEIGAADSYIENQDETISGGACAGISDRRLRSSYHPIRNCRNWSGGRASPCLRGIR